MKEIQLTKGFVTLVDDEDFDRLFAIVWQVHCIGKCKYAKHGGRKSKSVMMHRLILGITDPNIVVDHIDGNGLNNQKYNLRTASIKQNVRNQSRSHNHKGAFLIKPTGRYMAQIMVNRKSIWLGSFTTQREAALAYNEAAIKYFGEFANLNKIV